MDKQRIIQAIQENPQMDYEEMKKQALEAGMSEGDFEKVWNEARPNAKNITQHDLNICKIQDEIRKLGKDSKTREQWKTYMKIKGYIDDEFDMAYALIDIVVDVEDYKKQFKKLKYKLVVIIPIFIVVFFMLIHSFGWINILNIGFSLFIAFLLVSAFIVPTHISQQKLTKQIIEIDFEGQFLEPKFYRELLKK